MKIKKETIITSEAYTLIKQDIERWLKNILKFSAPAILVGLVAIKEQSVEVAITSFAWALYGAIVDLLRKFISETQYTIENK